MDIKNSNGLVGKYNDRDVYVATRKEYDSFNNISNNIYYILKDYLTIEWYFTLLLRNKIIGYCKNDGGIKIIHDREVPYVRANAKENEISMQDRREYKYTIKDAPQSDKEESVMQSIAKMCASASKHIKDGLLYSDKLLKQEQERAQSLYLYSWK